MQQCPNTIIEQYGNIMLSADVMHVNGIPFFITRSRHIHFGTVDVLPSLQANHIGVALRRVEIYICLWRIPGDHGINGWSLCWVT